MRLSIILSIYLYCNNVSAGISQEHHLICCFGWPSKSGYPRLCRKNIGPMPFFDCCIAVVWQERPKHERNGPVSCFGPPSPAFPFPPDNGWLLSQYGNASHKTWHNLFLCVWWTGFSLFYFRLLLCAVAIHHLTHPAPTFPSLKIDEYWGLWVK